MAMTSALNAMRVILAGVAVLGLATLAVWQLAPHWIDDLDASIKTRYVNAVFHRLDRAKQAYREDRAAGRRLFEELLADLEAVKKGDRLSPIKRQALRDWVARLRGEAATDDAAERVDEWIAFDDKDLNARMARAELLLGQPGGQSRGLVELAALHQLLPEEPRFTGAYVEQLLLRDRAADAMEALERYLGARGSPGVEPVTGNWEVLWDCGEGFVADRRQALKLRQKGVALEFDFLIPAAATAVRLMLPARSSLVLFEPALVLGTWRIELATLTPEAHDLQLYANGLVLDGGANPHLTWRIADTGRGEDVPFVLRATLLPMPLPWIEAVMALPGFAAFQEELQARDREAAAWLPRLPLRASQREVVTASWRGDETEAGDWIIPMLVGGRARGATVEFRWQVTVPVGMTELRVTLPDTPGRRWTITGITADGRSGSYPLPTDLRPGPGLRAAAGGFIVKGPDAYLDLTLSGSANRVQLNGSVSLAQ